MISKNISNNELSKKMIHLMHFIEIYGCRYLMKLICLSNICHPKEIYPIPIYIFDFHQLI